MAEGFEFLEHTADLKFRAHGSTLEDALVNCARAFNEATAGDSVIQPTESREVRIEAEDLQHLVHDWISELIFSFSTEHMLFARFDVKVEGKYTLTARISGEKYDPRRHQLYKEIKAATYHDMKIEQKKGSWTIEVVCDT
ncbi:MAG: archease [Candidatus Altiarchaeota archaeon]|nr:archease [Candidatus Altiarchaeota archaeon]